MNEFTSFLIHFRYVGVPVLLTVLVIAFVHYFVPEEQFYSCIFFFFSIGQGGTTFYIHFLPFFIFPACVYFPSIYILICSFFFTLGNKRKKKLQNISCSQTMTLQRRNIRIAQSSRAIEIQPEILMVYSILTILERYYKCLQFASLLI